MKITIKDYAALKGISTQAVYKSIREGRLETVTEDGTKYILIADQENGPEPEHEKTTKTDPKIETLLKEIELLREQNQELKKDKDILNQRLQESNIIQIKTIESFKQLEYRQQETEKALQEEKKKSWIDKLFRK